VATSKKRLGPADLNLDLGRGTDAPAFRWLIACQLFGARISQDIAAQAYRELDKLGVLSPGKLSDADWQILVDALGRGGYRRYDESTARELIEVGKQVRDEYGGHLTRLRREVGSRKDLIEKMQQFKGIGPTAADIFAREFAPLWEL
jgi:3-methyladenine DNA glycosylase/8-oxoguanine DNA glycosylase